MDEGAQGWMPDIVHDQMAGTSSEVEKHFVERNQGWMLEGLHSIEKFPKAGDVFLFDLAHFDSEQRPITLAEAFSHKSVGTLSNDLPKLVPRLESVDIDGRGGKDRFRTL